jgi:CRP-like cAMP-binding protein
MGSKFMMVPERHTLARCGEPIACIFISRSAVLAEAVPTKPGSSLDVALLGPGQIAGAAWAMGVARYPYDIVARIGGEVLAVPIGIIASGDLNELLQAAHRASVEQYLATAAMVSGFTTHRRLAGWIVQIDRFMAGQRLIVTHDNIAASLNTRRPSVSTSIAILEGMKFIRVMRKQIQILDRPGLIAHARVT